jgi:hypothetical protein
MTLQQTITTSTNQTNELFDKLQNTSDQAVKTRENLFSDLDRELRLYADLEQRHLFPALRKHDETKGLVPDARKANKDLLVQLDGLAALPKGDAEFLPRLGALRKLYQQHLRDERKELLPAVQKALSQEEADAVASKIDAGRAQADEEQRAEAEERKLAAKRQREAGEAVAAGLKAAEDTVDATKQKARDVGNAAVDRVEQGAKSAKKATRKAGKEASDTARRLKDRAGKTVTVLREEARERGQDVKAVGAAIRTLAQARSDLGALVKDAVKRSGRNGLETTKRLARKPSEFGQVQRDFAATATRNLMETTSELMQIVRRASDQARRPVEQRIREVA